LPVLAIVGVVVLVLFGALFSIDKTLKAHPELALMDGAEYVSYKQLQAGAKGIEVIPAESVPVAGTLRKELPSGEKQ
jgi:hypothetical protein